MAQDVVFLGRRERGGGREEGRREGRRGEGEGRRGEGEGGREAWGNSRTPLRPPATTSTEASPAV